MRISDSILKKKNITLFKAFFMENGQHMDVKSDRDIFTLSKENAVKVLLLNQPDKRNLDRFIGRQVSFFVAKFSTDKFDKDTEYNMDNYSILYSIQSIVVEDNNKLFSTEENIISELEYEYNETNDTVIFVKLALSELKI